RKVYQEGLVIPLGNVAVIGVEGWVDFDQNIDLVARFAMIPPRRNIPVLSQILENTQLQVPITGTLRKPRLNGEAIKGRLKDMGTTLLETMMDVGASGRDRLLRGGPGRAGQAPPPPRDFFPPFVPPPPKPDRDLAPARAAPRPPRPDEPASPPPDADGDAQLDRRPDEPEELTSRQRQQMQREERKQRRLEKRNERRARRGLPPK